jgi:hypothetical protein
VREVPSLLCAKRLSDKPADLQLLFSCERMRSGVIGEPSLWHTRMVSNWFSFIVSPSCFDPVCVGCCSAVVTRVCVHVACHVSDRICGCLWFAVAAFLCTDSIAQTGVCLSAKDMDSVMKISRTVCLVVRVFVWTLRGFGALRTDCTVFAVVDLVGVAESWVRDV